MTFWLAVSTLRLAVAAAVRRLSGASHQA